MSTAIWWVRRDLRLSDNPTLHAALAQGVVVPVFIFDPALLQAASERRRSFLVNGLKKLDKNLQIRGSRLVLRAGPPEQVLHELYKISGAKTIYAEEDFTPYARRRDGKIARVLPLELIQGQLIHHPLAVRKENGKPYTVFTPFSKTWKALLPDSMDPLPSPDRIPFPEIGIQSDPFPPAKEGPYFPPGEIEALQRLRTFTATPGSPAIFSYDSGRNMLDQQGTSELSPYFHTGMLSIRQAVSAANKAASRAAGQEQREGAKTWINELIWREFYISILFHYPRVLQGSFRQKYASIAWNNNQAELEAWKQGKTGYPIVDAAMRQLLETGWMHNRARMITASFLVKDLLIDWRHGEAWFMQHLLDADLAANNGGWQWTAGTGTDAAPYFRIFNPILQSKKFDPKGSYIRRWVPELAHLQSEIIHDPWTTETKISDYPPPIVDHKQARERTLQAFKAASST
jgi:deoxyribodipyrimidine photo-lyase